MPTTLCFWGFASPEQRRPKPTTLNEAAHEAVSPHSPPGHAVCSHPPASTSRLLLYLMKSLYSIQKTPSLLSWGIRS